MMGGPGRILSEGVILSSLVSGKRHQAAAAHRAVSLFASLSYPWTAGQRCPALSPSTIQTPHLGHGRRLVNIPRCVICAFGAVSEGPGVCAILRDRTLLMALGAKRWGRGNRTVPDPWYLVSRQGPDSHQGLSTEWGCSS